MVNKDYQ